jgi:UPF0755 protein
MDDFRRRPVNKVRQPTPAPQPPQPTPQQGQLGGTQEQQLFPQTQTLESTETSSSVQSPSPVQSDAPVKKRRISKAKLALIIIGPLLSLAGAAFAATWFWYTAQLAPVDEANTDKVVVSIESGSTPSTIADTLKESGVIRDQTAFLWYTRFEGVQNNLQAGAYRLSPSESTREIVNHLVSGKVDMFNVTLYPGATLVDATDTADDKKLDVTSALKRAGYTQEEIAAGLAADYSDYANTLFQDRPATADLEGYIFGETYRMPSDATVEDILRASFDQFWSVIEENDLVAKFEAQGLNLYQGITMASIIQRESGGDDKEEIAQVFYTRYRGGQQLGSDVTYQYIADKLGENRDINFDSPYNTRRYAGLPPGPISAPGENALIATGTPANTDYVFFLSGDDDVTYFARTLEEHEANIRNHCQQKCQII